MVKKIVLGVLLLVVLYFAGGIGLLALGKINRLYFLPGWSIKGPHSVSDFSGVAADGPLVVSEGGRLISKRIVPSGNSLLVQTDTLRPDGRDTLTCFVQETKREFRVPLRRTPDSLAVEATEYPAPAKWLALSDIEGNFKGFESLLRGAGVVDQHLAWQFGKGHLVLVGDFFDRGLNVTECLWLIYKLEQEAKQAGGKVHFILGNHERMNLTGHYKYVRRKYRANADTLGIPYENWYDRSTVLGQWLRTKNVVERIGGVLFVHGGISPAVATQRLSLNRLNALARASIDTPVAQLSAQERQATQPPSSPDWYRGLVFEEAEEAEVAQILAAYSASTMVVGHTPVERIKPLYHGKVIAIDLPHQELTDKGQPLHALLMENGKLRVLDSQGRSSAVQ
ncbi:metallophosphoesterase [Hymenobacter sp. YC55]|uniref:metallophosphoesterase n=1 Tax=Hymenobacter sp. YC55 TaxID=3034019 RepID=UPI0023F997DD|nr:metallophosphoesterase [Hymenobacter sp. YC55]MDF7810116.1 metallophosphoesterase [Hymenobacter sp. YC55]